MTDTNGLVAQIRSQNYRLHWLEEFREVTLSVLRAIDPKSLPELEAAKLANLLRAEYAPTDRAELSDLATEYILVPDKLMLTLWDDGRWHFCAAYLPGEFTVHVEECRDGFASAIEGYAYWLANPDMIEHKKQPVPTSEPSRKIIEQGA